MPPLTAPHPIVQALMPEGGSILSHATRRLAILDWQRAVAVWMVDAGQFVADHPTHGAELPPGVLTLREDLLSEEVDEFEAAMAVGDPAEAAKEGADVIVIVLGTMAAMGVPMDIVFDIVMSSNFEKLEKGARKRPDGKVMKPEGYVSPVDTIRQVLAAMVPA